MSFNRFPFAVRLIGFSQQETDIFDATFALEKNRGCGYFRLDDDNLQDPDLYIANAENLKALVNLADLHPSDVRPALLVGQPNISLPYASIERPIRWHRLFAVLDSLIAKRADALSQLEASDVVTVPERRRRDRVDIDLSDPADFRKLRTELLQGGAVLVVDKNSAFRDYLAELLIRHRVDVKWASSETEAVDACAGVRMAVVIVNTSIPEVDAYRLCDLIKKTRPQDKTSVILLVAKSSAYDTGLARRSGADGFLTKPVAAHHLMNALKKFMNLPR